MRDGAIPSFENFWRIVWQKPTGSMLVSPFHSADGENHNEVAGARQHSQLGGEFIGTFKGEWLKCILTKPGDGMWFEVDSDHVSFHVNEKTGMGVFTATDDGAGRSDSLTPSALNEQRSLRCIVMNALSTFLMRRK